MKTFKLIFVFLLSFFVLTTSAYAQDGKRMSGKTKGTLIGAGAGVVGGAVVGGGKGALIGGAAGAVGGRLLGKRSDKKKAAKVQQQQVVSARRY
jgi:osmotically inducible lipoprotein OsmB